MGSEMCIRDRNRTLALWIAVGWFGFVIAPWHVIEDGFWGFEWVVDGYPFDPDYAPALLQAWMGEAVWFAPIAFFLLVPLLALKRGADDPMLAPILLFAGIGGLVWVLGQGFTIGISGWRYEWMDAAFGQLDSRQYGMGYGALMVCAAFLFITTQGICLLYTSDAADE